MICDRANDKDCKLYAAGTCVGEAKRDSNEERFLGINASDVPVVECGYINRGSYITFVNEAELHEAEFKILISEGSR